MPGPGPGLYMGLVVEEVGHAAPCSSSPRTTSTACHVIPFPCQEQRAMSYLSHVKNSMPCHTFPMSRAACHVIPFPCQEQHAMLYHSHHRAHTCTWRGLPLLAPTTAVTHMVMRVCPVGGSIQASHTQSTGRVTRALLCSLVCGGASTQELQPRHSHFTCKEILPPPHAVCSCSTLSRAPFGVRWCAECKDWHPVGKGEVWAHWTPGPMVSLGQQGLTAHGGGGGW
jgi:hypothetical protein